MKLKLSTIIVTALLSIISYHFKTFGFQPGSIWLDNTGLINMPPYSREFLLLTGRNVLTSKTAFRVDLDTHKSIQGLGLSTVKPTKRGKRSGKHVRERQALKTQRSGTSNLLIGLCNARSISNKWDYITDHMVDNKLDILMVTETWLAAGSENDTPLKQLPAGYSMLQIPRQHKRGGGVALIYRTCIEVKSHQATTGTSFEGLEVLMTVKSSCLRLITIYRTYPSPENGYTVAQFIAEFSDYMEKIVPSSGRLLIGGDFNFHWDKPQDPDTIRIRDTLSSLNLQQHVSGATHISGHCLDWFLTHESDDLVKSTEISTLISDHNMIHLTANLVKPPLPRERRIYRSYKSIDPNELQLEIETSTLISQPKDDLNELVEQYNETLSALIDKHAPLKEGIVTIRPVTPWYNEAIHAAKAVRRKCEAIWRKTRLTIHRDIFTAARNKVSTLIKKAKIMYFTEKIEECNGDQKALFGVVNEILGRKKEQSLPPHENLKDVLDKFSVFFHTKINTIRQNLDAEIQLQTDNLPSVLPIHDPPLEARMNEFNMLSVEDVRKLVAKSPTKSCGLDPLPTWLLKKIVNPLLPTMTHIINKSLQSSIFPQALKYARVTPLLKKANLDKSILKNYRPVSNLAFISKLLERAALHQLLNHMDNNNLFCPIQSAYRPKHSTETALVKIQNDILLHLDSGKGVILVLLDLSAAFDTIDHTILMSRLQSRIGITGPALDWFHSYLADRYQCVHIQGQSSDSVPLVYGVPQGSVLGPFEFLIYMCPVYSIAEKHNISIHQYADDTQLYVAFDFDNQQESLRRMEACVNDIRTWMRLNKLKLNDDKTELIIIAPARHAHKVTINSIKIGDCTVKSSRTARNLGATFDDTMCLNQHISSLVKSCNAQLRSIGQARRFLSTAATEKVIHAFLSSRLDNGNSLLYGLPTIQIQRLQRIQNTAARILTRTKKHEHISPVLKSLHWLPISKRIEYKILTLTFKCLHSLAPSYLKDLIKQHKPGRSLRSASQRLLHVPATRLKSYGDRAFSKAAPLLWNSLPLHIRQIDNLDDFKSMLKTHLFTEG